MTKHKKQVSPTKQPDDKKKLAASMQSRLTVTVKDAKK